MSTGNGSADPQTTTARAVAAATEAARELGVEVTEPRVLYEAFSVVVHLAPAPLVARVPTVLPAVPSWNLDLLTARQRNELDVTAWLAEQGVPVAGPSSLVPREPVRRDGFSITYWRYLTPLPDLEPDYAPKPEAVAELHAHLRGYPGDLPFLTTFTEFVPEALRVLESRPDLLRPEDVDRARREWAVLAPVVGSRERFEAEFPGVDLQPVHGDAPSYNLIRAEEGTVYADFELVSIGPRERDMALTGEEAVAAYDVAAARHGLRPLDRRVLAVVENLGMLEAVSSLALVDQLPLLAEALPPMVEQWRSSEFAGGLGRHSD
ncbi:aminoglycoside phosphotransferase family protein [Actinoalloteichus caeruleus]|uniref:aminoglycoside phosphotransferase family protein n=1 Tax=Actinoalloteichus cyanogriseus TaxID=2893586 RepID=UPI003BB94D10